MQLRPVEFKIVAANSASECQKTINALLSEDWVMHGDLKVNFAAKDDEPVFVQAMARLELKPPPGMEKMTSSIAVPSPHIPIIQR